MRRVFLALPLLLACSHASTRSSPTKAGELLGQSSTCTDPTGPAQILVVDWTEDQRIEMETLLKKRSVLVVASTCQGVRPLPGCHLAGDYGYTGIVPKERVERLAGRSEISANLPLGGLALAGKLGAGESDTSALDVATVTAGLRRTTRKEAAKSDLEGVCDGATHFVQSVNVGAFAVRSAKGTQTVAAASVFGAGVEHKDSGERTSAVTDGSIEACRASDAGGSSPPKGCGATLRVDLVPIIGAVAAVEDARCPAGLRWTGDKCTAAEPHLCQEGQLEDCKTECSRGHLGSCHRLGRIYDLGDVAPKDRATAATLYKRACDGGNSVSCNNLALLMLDGDGVPKDVVGATKLLHAACDQGVAKACVNLGASYYEGTLAAKNVALGARLFRRGCEGGEPGGCFNLSIAFVNGAGVEKNDAESFRMAERACDGDMDIACARVARALLQGAGVTADAARATRLLEDKCDAKKPQCCMSLAFAYHDGQGVVADPRRASKYAERSCELGHQPACGLTKVWATGEQITVKMAEQVTSFQERCAKGVASACGSLGYSLFKGMGVDPDVARGTDLLKKSCADGYQWSCDKMKELGIAR